MVFVYPHLSLFPLKLVAVSLGLVWVVLPDTTFSPTLLLAHLDLYLYLLLFFFFEELLHAPSSPWSVIVLFHKKTQPLFSPRLASIPPDNNPC